MPDAATIKAFLDITGPWGVVGILLLFIFLWLRKDDKSVRATLDAQISSFETLLATLCRLEEALKEHDERAREIKLKQESLNEAFSTLTTTILAQHALPVGRKGQN